MQRTAHPESVDVEPSAKRPRLRIGVCAAYAVVLGVLGLFGLMPINLAVLSLADFSDANRLLDYGVRTAVGMLLNVICFGVLGGMVASLPDQTDKLSRRVGTILLSVAIACFIATLVLSCRDGWPYLANAAVPWFGSAVGVWVVSLWRGGKWSRWSLVLQGIALVIGIPVLAWCSLSHHSLPFQAIEISSEDKRHLVKLVREHETQQRPEGPVNVLHLNQHEVELLANWGLQVADGHQTRSKSTVRLTPDGFTLELALWLGGPLERFLNLRAQGAVEVNRGELNLQLHRLRLGKVQVPSPLLPLLAKGVESYIHSEEELASVLSHTALIRIDTDALSVELEKGVFRDKILADLEFVDPEVRLATIAQLQRLAQLFQPNRPPPSFETCVQASFALAAERTSANATEAIDENRAALYALGIVLGHPRLGELILGPQFDGASYRAAAANVGRVPLRGRRDLTRHFAVSAALSCYSNARLSDAAGLLKEELDAGAGGSGFSFVDLLADRAGTRFAQAATRNEAAALSMQQRLANAWALDDLFPADKDLPEGLSDAELEQLGGIGGHSYQEIIRDIEQRLDHCELLRSARQ